MGEPDSMNIEEDLRRIVLRVLGPRGAVSAASLREMGLHRDFLQLHFQSIMHEIKYLVGWKALREYRYSAHYRADRSEIRKSETLTETWVKMVGESGVADEHAVMIFDGELRPLPAPDYRLFLLRDGRMLYYAGGMYGSSWNNFACGDVLEVLDVLDKRYSAASSTSPARQPFLIIAQALADALDKAIKDREAKIRSQRVLQERLIHAIKQVSAN